MQNLSNFGNFPLRYFITGSATASPIAAGTMVPRVANRKIIVFDMPSLNPKGIASLRSKGVIAAKNTFSSGSMK